MSLRARIALIGLLAIGNAGALATAPQIVDPQEDAPGSEPASIVPRANDSLLLQRPERSPPPASEEGGPAKPNPHPAQVPAASRAKPELPANPLWAIPLNRLTETRNRPPFSPSRRPVQPVVVAKPVAPPAPPPKPPEPVKPQLSLIGTIVGGSVRVGLFVNASDKSTIRLKAGENHQGWVLRAVETHQVELVNGLDSAVLKLPPPDIKPIASASPPLSPVASAPAAPPPAPVAAPQGTPMPSSPANAAQPVNMTLPKDPNPPGTTKSAVKPPVFDAPAQITNPFAEAMSKWKGAAQ